MKSVSNSDSESGVEQSPGHAGCTLQREPFIDINSQLHDRDVERYCALEAEERMLMKNIYEQYDLSARTYHKILKVARTIADLSGHLRITTDDISEAVFYKCLDGRYWGSGNGKG